MLCINLKQRNLELLRVKGVINSNHLKAPSAEICRYRQTSKSSKSLSIVTGKLKEFINYDHYKEVNN